MSSALASTACFFPVFAAFFLSVGAAVDAAFALHHAKNQYLFTPRFNKDKERQPTRRKKQGTQFNLHWGLAPQVVAFSTWGLRRWASCLPPLATLPTNRNTFRLCFAAFFILLTNCNSSKAPLPCATNSN